MLGAIDFSELRLQDKDPEDIAEDFRNAIWKYSDHLGELANVWAAGKCFIDGLYGEDEYTCMRPKLPEGLERLETSLNNVAHYVLNLSDDVDTVMPVMV